MFSVTAVVQRFFVCTVLAVLCTVATFLLLYYRLVSVCHVGKTGSHVDTTGSHVLKLTVVETETRICGGSSPVRLNTDTDREICRPLLRGDATPLGRSHRSLSPAPSMTVDEYIELATADCHCFRSRLGYFTAADTTPEERAFPIAFSLLTYENLEQTERLLRLVYRPHNL